VAGTALALLALGAVALAGGREPAVVVRDGAGEEVVRAELPASGRFTLGYRHSYYDAPAHERFEADGGGFRLRSLASPSAAVLDYYALEGRRTRDGRWVRLTPREQRRYERLPLIATAEGRRTLLVGERRFPLYGSEPRHLTITVEPGAPLADGGTGP
jgi:hypothetical protein